MKLIIKIKEVLNKFNWFGKLIIIVLLSPVWLLLSMMLGFIVLMVSIYKMMLKDDKKLNLEVSDDELEYINHDIDLAKRMSESLYMIDEIDIKDKTKTVAFNSMYPKVMMADTIEWSSHTIEWSSEMMFDVIDGEFLNKFKYYISKSAKRTILYHRAKLLGFNSKEARRLRDYSFKRFHKYVSESLKERVK